MNAVRWTETMPNSVFANQAATLWITYYLVQMVIFRPFIPAPAKILSKKEKDSLDAIPPFPFNAMDICLKAADECARIIKVQSAHGFSNIPAVCMVSHTAAGMLSWAIWDLKIQEESKRLSNIDVDVKPPAIAITEFMANLEVFVHTLETTQPRWAVVTPLLCVVLLQIAVATSRLPYFDSANLRESLPTWEDLLQDNRNRMPSLLRSHEALSKKPMDLYFRNKNNLFDTPSSTLWRESNPLSWRWTQPTGPLVQLGERAYSTRPSIVSTGSALRPPSPIPIPMNPTHYLDKELGNLYTFSDKSSGVPHEPELGSSYINDPRHAWPTASIATPTRQMTQPVQSSSAAPIRIRTLSSTLLPSYDRSADPAVRGGASLNYPEAYFASSSGPVPQVPLRKTSHQALGSRYQQDAMRVDHNVGPVRERSQSDRRLGVSLERSFSRDNADLQYHIPSLSFNSRDNLASANTETRSINIPVPPVGSSSINIHERPINYSSDSMNISRSLDGQPIGPPSTSSSFASSSMDRQLYRLVLSRQSK